jgi:hypothetical protein
MNVKDGVSAAFFSSVDSGKSQVSSAKLLTCHLQLSTEESEESSSLKIFDERF